MPAQVAALDHSHAFSALTLVGTRVVAPGPVDEVLPDHGAAAMEALFSLPGPDWSDRAEVAAAGAELAALLGNDPVQARETESRIWDRTPGRDPAIPAKPERGGVRGLDCAPRWRERLGELGAPWLVVHGRLDPFFPVGNGEAIAAAVPGARLLVVKEMGTAVPDVAVEEVAPAMLAL